MNRFRFSLGYSAKCHYLWRFGARVVQSAQLVSCEGQLVPILNTSGISVQGLDGVDTHLSRGIVSSCAGWESGIHGMQGILWASTEKLIYCIEISIWCHHETMCHIH